jgi:multiple sugar transport system ATP-binding protein
MHLAAEVTVVEPLGREILVRTTLPMENRSSAPVLNIQLPPTVRPKVGDRLPLQFDLNHLCLFEPTTGRNLAL